MAESAIGALAVRITGDVADFVQKMDRADKAVGKFSNQLERRLLAPLAKVSAAAGAAAAGVFLFTKRATDMVDQLGKMSQKLGVSVESLSALKHAAALSDVSLEQLSVGLRQMSKNMADMQAGTGEARQAFQAMKASVEEAPGKLKGTEQMFIELAERFSKMEDGAGKTALAMRLFGKSGADLIPLLNEGRAGIEKLRAEAERLGIVFSTESAKAAEEFNDNVTRLEGAVDGLQVKLAGPLVTALNQAAEAMLNAQRRGEGFFSTLIEGWRVLVTGDDAHKWNVQMAEAGESLLQAQNKLDQAMRVQRSPGMREWGERLVKEAKEAVDRAQAEIARLQGIKPFLAPDAPKPAEGGGKKAAPALEDPGRAAAIQRENEAAAKAIVEGEEEEARIRFEASEALAEFQVEKFKREKQLIDDLQAAKIEAAEWEQEQAIQQGEELLAIDRAIAEQKKAQQDRELQARRTFVENLAGLMNTSSKKAFEFGKKVALARAAVEGAQAVMSAWRSGMETTGPWAPVVAAAYAAAAAVNAGNLINNIRSQQFGGGGGAPVAPSQGASGVSPVGAGGAGPQGSRGPDNIIHLHGETFSQKQLRDLFDRLNEGQRDGGRFVLA